MKKLLFVLMLMGAVAQVKAQANFYLQPFNKTPDSLYKNKVQRIDITKRYAYNPMPIVRMEGRSNMPIVKMQGNSKMPVIDPNAGVNAIVPKELP